MSAHIDDPRTMSRRWLFLLGLIALLLPAASRADDWYMKIEGIPGELTEGPFKGWSRLTSVGSFVSPAGVQESPTPGSTRVGCLVSKELDRMSPVLLESCGIGAIHRRVSISFVPTTPPATQYRITLEDVMVSSFTQVSASTSGASAPSEQMSLNFEKIQWACLAVDELGGNTGGLTALYDRVRGEASLKGRRPFRATIGRAAGTPGLVVTCPVEKGHRYRILSSPSAGKPWQTLLEFTAEADGDSSQFVPSAMPSLLLRVEEID
jgi:type VI protein secretion system component Hcp